MNQPDGHFEQIIADNKDRLYRICYAYLYDAAQVDDLYQDILINVWQGLKKFRSEAAVSTWIYRIAVNTALMYNRKTQREQQLFYKTDQIPQQEVRSEVDEKVKMERQLAQLTDCIRRLPKADNLMASLLLEGMSYKEIAEIMGITVNHTGVKVKRLKEKLKKQMSQYEHAI
ncbi:MAG: sigma-70 family RNA polymerase sigma factor [Bacteroidota bacterium]